MQNLLCDDVYYSIIYNEILKTTIILNNSGIIIMIIIMKSLIISYHIIMIIIKNVMLEHIDTWKGDYDIFGKKSQIPKSYMQSNYSCEIKGNENR